MRLTTIFALGLALCGVGCDDDSASMGGGMDMAALGVSDGADDWDDAARPHGSAGVNTALTKPFETDKTAREEAGRVQPGAASDVADVRRAVRGDLASSTGSTACAAISRSPTRARMAARQVSTARSPAFGERPLCSTPRSGCTGAGTISPSRSGRSRIGAGELRRSHAARYGHRHHATRCCRRDLTGGVTDGSQRRRGHGDWRR